MQAPGSSSSIGTPATAGGKDNNTFKVKLRHGGRIEMGNPPKYVGGSVRWFSDLDYDEWGLITLWERVEQLGYKREGCRCFAKTDSELIELILDLEAWNLVNHIVRPTVLEIWVIVGVLGEDERGAVEVEAFQTDEGVVGEVESTDEEYDSGDYLEDELEKLEDSDYEIDDSEFLKFIDPEVEYAGEGNVAIPETEVAELVPTNTERRAAQGDIPAAQGAQGDIPAAQPAQDPILTDHEVHTDIPAAHELQSDIPAAQDSILVSQDPIPAAQPAQGASPTVQGPIPAAHLPSLEEIPLADFESVPEEDTQIDPLLSVGDNIYPIVEDVNSQIKGLTTDNNQAEGMKATSHGVRICYGQPPKRGKTTVHGSKEEEGLKVEGQPSSPSWDGWENDAA
nr:transposase, MuDR [Ipomoea batatas]